MNLIAVNYNVRHLWIFKNQRFNGIRIDLVWNKRIILEPPQLNQLTNGRVESPFGLC